jgi:histidine triad (HIT) family protein
MAQRQRPANPGHVLVCPVTHATALHSTEPSLLTEVFNVVTKLTSIAPVAFGAMGTTVLNNNDAPDQVISHLHIHVIPRFKDDNLTIPNPDRSPTPRGLRADLAARLRQAM